MKQEDVSNVEESLQLTNMLKPSVVQKAVPVNFVGIKSIKKLDNADVYNMTVEDLHNYIVNDGLVSKNCDSDRYALYTYSLFGQTGIYSRKGA